MWAFRVFGGVTAIAEVVWAIARQGAVIGARRRYPHVGISRR